MKEILITHLQKAKILYLKISMFPLNFANEISQMMRGQKDQLLTNLWSFVKQESPKGDF